MTELVIRGALKGYFRGGKVRTAGEPRVKCALAPCACHIGREEHGQEGADETR
jgi:hypothetical protein